MGHAQSWRRPAEQHPSLPSSVQNDLCPLGARAAFCARDASAVHATPLHSIKLGVQVYWCLWTRKKGMAAHTLLPRKPSNHIHQTSSDEKLQIVVRRTGSQSNPGTRFRNYLTLSMSDHFVSTGTIRVCAEQNRRFDSTRSRECVCQMRACVKFIC